MEHLKNPQVIKCVVIGECGAGKSHLINKLVGCTVAESGRSAGGITKGLGYHYSAQHNAVLIDTPGVGDFNVKLHKLVELLTEAFKSTTIHAVIVCSKSYTRVQCGGDIVARIVNLSFPDASKWNNVIFTWTHGDKATDEDIDNIPEALAACMEQIGVAERPRTCVTKCPPTGDTDVSQLVNILSNLRSSGGIGTYVAPTAAALSSVVGNVMANADKAVQESQRKEAEAQANHERAMKEAAENQRRAAEEHERRMQAAAAEAKRVQEEQVRVERERQEAERRRLHEIREQNARRHLAFGGGGGGAFGAHGINSIAIRAGGYVDAIIINGHQFGGGGGRQTETLHMQPGEVITSVHVRAGRYIDYLCISTNRGRSISGGGGGGAPHTFACDRVESISGRCGCYLDHIGFNVVQY